MKIFYDVDTQNDFMNKDEALYVPDAELIKPNLAELTKYAERESIPIMGSVDKHFGTLEYKKREGELARWGGPFPDHCMDGTFGQKKIKETTTGIYDDVRAGIYDSREYIPHLKIGDKELRNRKDWLNTINLGKQMYISLLCFTRDRDKSPIYFEKQSYDVFTNPSIAYFLEKAEVKEAVVYGVATDFCVKAAVLGMQKRGIQCYVVEDAIKGVFPDKTKEALEEMAKAGAKFVKTKDVLEGRLE